MQTLQQPLHIQSGFLQLSGDRTPDVAPSGMVRLWYDNQAGVLKVSASGASYGAVGHVQSDGSLRIAASPPASATAALVGLGPAAIASGDADGTYLGINAATGYAGDFANCQVNGTMVFKVDGAGALTCTRNSSSDTMLQFQSSTTAIGRFRTITIDSAVSPCFETVNSRPFVLFSGSTGTKLLILKAASGQTSNLFEARSNADAILTHIGPAGRPYLHAPATAPTDGDMQNSQIHYYLDEATPAVKARIKKADGTFLTLTITNGADPTLA